MSTNVVATDAQPKSTRKYSESDVYRSEELELLDHSIGIIGKLIRGHNDETKLMSMSIEKTDGVLKNIDSGIRLVNSLASTRIKLLQMDTDSNDRGRLMSLLNNVKFRNVIGDEPRTLDIPIDTEDEPEIVYGELDEGVEQLSIKLLELEGEKNDDDLL